MWKNKAFRFGHETFYSAHELADLDIIHQARRQGKSELIKQTNYLLSRYHKSYSRSFGTHLMKRPDDLAYFEYQKAGIDFLCKVKHALLADEQGLGKTIQVIGMMNIIKPKRTLIICPASLKLNWQEELDRWGDLYFRWSQVINGSDQTFYPRATVTIVNYEMCQKLRRRIGKDYDLVVLDEAHYLQNHEAQRTMAIIGPRGIARNTERIVAISGTPLSNRPIELWPLLASVFAKYMPKEFLNREKFGKHFCAGFWENVKTWNAKKKCYEYLDKLNVQGSSNLQTLNYMLRERFMIRRKKKDVLPQLPDKTYSVVNIATTSQARIILKKEEKYRDEVIRSIETGDRLPALEEISSVRKEIALLKIPYAAEFIQNILKSEEKVIVFCYHTDVAKALTELFRNYGLGVSLLIGETNMKDRDKAVKDFQDGDNRVFIGNIEAAGTGLTLTSASNVVFVECSWVPGQNEQAVDRAHRIGQIKKVNAYYLVWYGSLDARILKTAISKQRNINKVLK